MVLTSHLITHLPMGSNQTESWLFRSISPCFPLILKNVVILERALIYCTNLLRWHVHVTSHLRCGRRHARTSDTTFERASFLLHHNHDHLEPSSPAVPCRMPPTDTSSRASTSIGDSPLSPAMYTMRCPWSVATTPIPRPTRVVANADQLVILNALYARVGEDATKKDVEEASKETGL